MAAPAQLTADFNSQQSGYERLRNYKVATAAPIFEGSLVVADGTSGLAEVCPLNDGLTDNSALRIVGQATNARVAADPAGSTVTVRTDTDVVLDWNDITPTAIGQTLVGTLVYATSDHEVTTIAALNPKAGVLVGITSGGQAIVALSTTKTT